MKFFAWLMPSNKKSETKDIDTGNPKFDKTWGQFRHFVDSFATIFLSWGILENYGVSVTPDSLSVFLDMSEEAVNISFMLVGLVGKIVTHASSWYSK